MARNTLQAKITADAVFASELQRSDEPSPSSIRKAVQAAMRTFGSCGCAARVAQEFGDHPEAAAARMRWALSLVGESFGSAGAAANCYGNCSKEHGLRQQASISNTNIRKRDEMGALHPGQDSRLFHSPGSARSPGADPGGRMRSQPTSMPA
jgi:hypothetical protein